MRGEEKRNKKPCIYGKDSKSGNVKKHRNENRDGVGSKWFKFIKKLITK